MLALFVLSALSILLTTLSITVGVNMKIAGYFKKDVSAAALARGAVKRMAAELEPKAGLGQNEALARIKGEILGVWTVLPADWSIIKGELTDKDEYIITRITSEDAKLPIKKLNKNMVSKFPGISPVLAEAIGVKLKAASKSGGLRSVEELLTVEGVTAEVFYGKDDKPGLKDLITAYSDGKIYINNASRHVMAALPGVDRQVGVEIENKIKSGRFFERVDEVKHVLGVTPRLFKVLKKWVKVTPSYYRIEAEAFVNGVSRKSEGVAKIGTKGVEMVYLQGG